MRDEAFFDSNLLVYALCARLLTEEMQNGIRVDRLEIRNPF